MANRTLRWLAPALLLSCFPAWGENYKVDPVHSSLIFRIRHFDVSAFYGRFNLVEGSFALDAKDPARCRFDIQVPVDKLDTNQAKRDEHLKGPDFFNAKEFPILSFKSRSVVKNDDPNHTIFNVTGDLTCHGVTKNLVVPVEVIGSGKTPKGQRAGVEANFVIKRSDFGLNAMPGLLGDEVRLVVSLEGIEG